LRFYVRMETAPTTPPPTPAPSSPSAKKPSLTKVLPSDRLALDRQFDALKAYAAAYEANGDKAVTNQKAGEISKLSAATIVVTNAFFCEIGLVTRTDEGFVPSPEAISYLRAVNGLSPETAGDKLRPLFEKQWFYQTLGPRLRLRPMETTEVVKVLGEESNAGKEHVPRLNMLIDFLVHVGVLKKEGNQITLGASAGAAPKKDDKPKGEDELPKGETALPIPLDARKGRNATLHFPTDITAEEVKKLISFIKLSFDIAEMVS
jgi:hypothetical protein